MRDEMKKVPRLRFRGFQEDWELCKVKDFLIESKIKGSNGKIAKKLTVKLWRKGIVAKEEVYEGSLATQYYVRKSGQFMYGKLDFLNQAFGIVPIELDGYESTVDSPSFDFKPLVDSVFFLEYVSLEKFYKYQGNIANGSRKAKRIHVETFFNMPLPTPSYKEQQKIGTLFKQLDDTITLHQRKLDQLKELKKAYLKAMFVSMNTKNNKVPKLRFTDFEGDWEQRKLGNISKMYQPQTITGTELLPSGYPVFGANGYIGFYSEMNHENDQVTISARGEGTGTINYVNGPVWITGNSMVINVNDFDINKRFLHANLSSNSLKKYITGGAQPQLTRDILTSVPIKLPNIFEQNKIGLFFKQLDETVNLHQNKLTQLKSLKKAYLQNMFI
ncbi:restriction endonuclease subunit S [Enterococcus faecalis]|uniref:restriction endonuclease subunit S n=1 Tax=Enterococcus faecalis TaxID=1351 RepID=UPI00226DA92D|nr:restriction endonuclease subunit S [Enterococcus faecalis]